MDGFMWYAWLAGWLARWMDGWMDGWIDGMTDGWIYVVCMDGLTD